MNYLKKFYQYLFSFIKNSDNKFIKNFFGYFLIFFVIRKFSLLTKGLVDIEKAVQIAFSFKFLEISIQPFQVKEEIIKLIDLVKELKPKIVLEIGTASGGTLFLFTRIVSSKGIILSIDLPGGASSCVFDLGYSNWKIPLYHSFSKYKQRIYLIRGDSHNINSYVKVKNLIQNSQVDFLFIDGDHRYEGVKRDFELYAPLVKKGGIIAFHDLLYQPESDKVMQFWNEIKNNYINLEIITDLKQGYGGIGVIYKN